MNLRIKVADSVSPRLQSLMRSLSGSGLIDVNRAAGQEVQLITVNHVAVIASTRHATAQRLGASPTNHFAQAAEKVAAGGALAADASGATLTISHVGFTRAFRDVKISPKSAKSLAIPIHATSYGKRASELWDRMGLFIPKGKRIIAATIGGVVTPLYILTKSVTQKQDRSLLPSDEQFQTAAVMGVKGWLGMVLAKGGNN